MVTFLAWLWTSLFKTRKLQRLWSARQGLLMTNSTQSYNHRTFLVPFGVNLGFSVQNLEKNVRVATEGIKPEERRLQQECIEKYARDVTHKISRRSILILSRDFLLQVLCANADETLGGSRSGETLAEVGGTETVSLYDPSQTVSYFDCEK